MIIYFGFTSAPDLTIHQLDECSQPLDGELGLQQDT